MQKQNKDTCLKHRTIIENAAQTYVQGILTSEELEDRMMQELEQTYSRDEYFSSPTWLTRLAQRICSRELCKAWYSTDTTIRNYAFDNLRRYLAWSLQHSHYIEPLLQYTGALEDVLHQTLETLHRMQKREQYAGPDDPATFLKWTQTIVVRQARVFLLRCQRDHCLSLEAQMELMTDRFVDKSNTDPLDYVLAQELHQTLDKAIASMRNQRYREVLVSTYLMGMEERELAIHLKVPVQDIYLWRHRALNALRKRPEVVQALRTLVE